MALVLPILMALFVAAVDVARVNNIRNTAEFASYASARQGIVAGKTATDIQNHAQASLDVIGIHEAIIDVVPQVITDETPTVTVRIDVPLNANLFANAWFFRDHTFHAECTLTRDFTFVE